MSHNKLAAEKKSVQAMLKKAKVEQKPAAQKSKASSSSIKKNDSSSSTTRVPKNKTETDEIRKKVAAELAAEESTIPEPPFQYEVHVKRQVLYVRVQLHKVPHQFINLDETNDTRLVVDTTKFTKKNRLVFEFPGGMSVDSSKAEYEFESGILRCSFPIRQLPADEVSRVQGIIQQQKNSRKLRFEHQLDQNTGMETRVRTRTFDMSKSSALLKSKIKKQKQQQQNPGNSDDDDKDDVPSRTMSSKEEREMILKIGKSSNNNKNKNNNKSKAAPATTTTATAGKKGASAAKYVADGAEGAQRIASQVSREATQNIKENISKIKKLAAVQNQKKQKSISAHQKKKDVLNRSFLDIVKQKQESVRQQIEASKPVERKNKGENSKTVSFA